ncbi:hypothetical protein GCM10010329_62860 [Streptomyces spiroverticillatus]|nr:hypothetical protein GCM10010329_62860 [Streptomyces spiroverticillatus]
MLAAAITASATLVVAIVAFLLNQWSQLRFERRQTRVTRIGEQLRLLYGPLNALVESNEHIWETLQPSVVPPGAQRRTADPSPEERATWDRWFTHAFMPTNRKMRNLIIEHADLLVEPELPEPLRLFCAHVAACEVALAAPAAEGTRPDVLIRHPGTPYATYVRESFARLKAEQLRLLGLLTPRAW